MADGSQKLRNAAERIFVIVNHEQTIGKFHLIARSNRAGSVLPGAA
jgi:hypothetical protein